MRSGRRPSDRSRRPVAWSHAMCLRWLANSFEPSNPTRQLIIIIVSVAAPHWLAVPAVFLNVLIHEQPARVITILVRVSTPLGIAPGNPLVPAGNKNELRVDFQSPTPLLVEVQPQIHRAFAQVLLPVVPASAHRSGFVAHGGGPRRVGQGVLGHADAHLLRFTFLISEHVLRKGLQPAPLFRSAWPLPIIRHGTSEGEEL